MSGKYRGATLDFAVQTASAQKILIIEIAGLCDLVHSLPAMWSLRRHYPRAELHCLVRQPYASLLKLTPWIDRVWSYRRGSSGTLLGKLQLFKALRAQHFDVSVNLMGTDHACLAAWISGATRRLVRKPGKSRPRRAWHRLSTDVMDEDVFWQEPMYLQRWQCLRQAGLGSESAQFQLDRHALDVQIPGMDIDARGYVHISPYTKLGRKELPPAQLAELVRRLRDELPQLRLVISCGPAPRELRALNELLGALPFAPGKVFAGTLDIPQLYRLIEGAALHVGGDTGSIHLAWLAGTPSVSWFLANGKHRAWAPRGDQHAVIYSTGSAADYIYGIDTDAVIAGALERVLGAPAALPREVAPA